MERFHKAIKMYYNIYFQVKQTISISKKALKLYLKAIIKLKLSKNYRDMNLLINLFIYGGYKLLRKFYLLWL